MKKNHIQKIKLNLQINNNIKYFIPKKKKIFQWIQSVLQQKSEITIRIVNIIEIKKINFLYRKKNKPTNILSFQYTNIYIKNFLLIGDLIICPKILQYEAHVQNKFIEAHWAHIIIHGILHLMGYKHNNTKEKMIMEHIEINIMKKLGYKNPYIFE
ncbi:rRNA maturation RNase YbeY [Buchnera aphidicola (Takecallis taiwana)]|uniref:rRNA maturation RNase YbeY n=1 Tax=Buchnera aphidicola TaxID=9 RepID=UPI0031B72127